MFSDLKLSDLTLPNPQLLPRTTIDLQAATKKDPDLVQLTKVISFGWPSCLKPYWCFRDEMSIHNGVIYRGDQAVIPTSLYSEMLAKIHPSHSGAESNIRMAKDIVYWPGMQSAIKDMCQNCGKEVTAYPTVSFAVCKSRLTRV